MNNNDPPASIKAALSLMIYLARGFGGGVPHGGAGAGTPAPWACFMCVLDAEATPLCAHVPRVGTSESFSGARNREPRGPFAARGSLLNDRSHDRSLRGL